MASYSTRLYLDTGFSYENIPDSASLLNNPNVKFIDVDAVWLYQNQEQGVIRVKSTFDNIYPVDYCRIGSSSYYFVTNVTMINPNTAELSLVIDAITTIGLNNITDNLAGGWCTRRCVTDDTLFNNCIDEDFVPTQPLENDTQDIKISNNGILAIVSSIDLSKVGELLSQGYKNSIESTSIDVSVPTVPAINLKYTKITIDYQGLKLTRELVGKRMYLVGITDGDSQDNMLVDALTTVWSLGLFDAIAGIYYLPIGEEGTGSNFTYEAVLNIGDGLFWISELTVHGGFFKLDRIPFKWNTPNVKNNKVFATKYNTYRLISMVSGNEAKYYAGDIYDNLNNPDAPNIAINIDGSDNGTTYAKPEYIRGVDLSQTSKKFEIMRDAVTGGDWVSLNYNQARPKGIIKTLNSLNLSRANTVLDIPSKILSNLSLPNLSKNGNIYESMTMPYSPSSSLVSQQQIAGGALDQVSPITGYNYFGNPRIGGFGNILGAISGLKDSGVGLLANSQEIANAVIQSPETWFPIDNTLSLFYGNSYYVIRERLSDEDTLKFDKYLTMYGYKVNEPLTKECFYGRQYFNYIKAEGINIKTINRVPLRLKQIAIEQLQGGIRIWHTLVNSNAYNNNPIV